MKKKRNEMALKETAAPYGLASSLVSNAFNVKAFCETFQLTQETFTRLTGFSPRAVANWVSGEKPSSSTTRRLTELRRVFAALEKLVPASTLGPWLMQVNEAFGGSTPLQVIERGELDRIWRMIYELEAGEPG